MTCFAPTSPEVSSQSLKLFAQFVLGSLENAELAGTEIFAAAVDIKIEH